MRKNIRKLLYIFLTILVVLDILFPIISYSTSPLVGTEDEAVSDEILTEIIEGQKSTLNISAFIKEANKYTSEVFPNIDTSEILSSALAGEIDTSSLFGKIINIIGEEVLVTIRILAMILAVVVVTSIIKTIAESLDNGGAAKVAYFVQYILIVTIILSNFSEIIFLVTDTIDNLIGFLYTLVPLLITLMISTGSIVSANLVQPLILFFITLTGNIVSILIVPIILLSTVLSIISNISDKIEIGKLSKFFKSTVLWVLGILLTIFVSALSIEGTLSSSIDGITAKTVKAAVSNLIPVVGKALGDSLDTVLGSAVILKNAVGVVGVIVILSISIIPIIKISLITIVYSLATALAEPIAEKKVVTLLEQIGDTFKVLLGILFVVNAMFLIGMTIVISMSNSGMMYR